MDFELRYFYKNLFGGISIVWPVLFSNPLETLEILGARISTLVQKLRRNLTVQTLINNVDKIAYRKRREYYFHRLYAHARACETIIKNFFFLHSGKKRNRKSSAFEYRTHKGPKRERQRRQDGQ